MMAVTSTTMVVALKGIENIKGIKSLVDKLIQPLQ